MEQHPIPRQITTFEFKLIGFMTLRQFIYLVVFFPLAYVIFRLFPIPILNILLALIVAVFGIMLAFFPVNDQPLDVFIKNFVKRLTSPTQFFYKKSNSPIKFLTGVSASTDPKTVITHIESQGKLSKYLHQTQKATNSTPNTKQQKQSLRGILENPVEVKQEEQPTQTPQAPPAPVVKKPFLTGLIKNNKQIPLPGILIYIKDQKDTPLRLLKTNPHGIFATYNKLPSGEYNVEIKDPKGTFFFDTMKIKLEDTNTKPLEFFSKELL